MAEAQDIQTAQEKALEGVIEAAGLVGDLLGGAASMVGGSKQNQAPSTDSSKPDSQKTQPQTKAVLDSNNMDFTQGQIPQDLGIPELKGVDPQEIAKFDRDIAISWGFALSDVNSVNEGRQSIGADMKAYQEPERVESIAQTKKSLEELIRQKGYTNEQLLKATNAKVDVDATLKTIDNNPTHPDSKPKPPSLDDALEEKPEQPREAPDLDIPKSEESKPKPKESKLDLEKASETQDQRIERDPVPQVLNSESATQNSKATARTPKQAKAEVQKLGKGIESELGEILGSNVEMKIYSASTLVYPPKAKTKITPETSDKLNRAFTDPSSVKGTITLSIRTDEGKLEPIYQVSNGKIKQDTLGLRKPVVQNLPEPKQSLEAKPESSSRKVESKPDATPKPTEDKVESSSRKVESKPESKPAPKSNLNSSAEQTQPQPEFLQKGGRPEEVIKAQDSALDAADRVIEAQSNKILELEKRIERLEKIESSLKQAGVPKGITDGVNQANRTLGQRFRAAAKELAVTTGAAAISGASHVIKTASNLISKAEGSQVYKSGKFITGSVGTEQPDGSKTFTKGKEIDLKLKGDELTVSNKAGKVLFQGNSKTQGMSANASIAESMKVKQVAFAAQQLKSQQQQRQQQSQKQAVGGMKR